MDSRSAPPNIHFCHLNNQLANFGRNSRSSETALSTLPPPEESESLTMPGQNGGWFHHRQTFPPAIPEAGQQHPEDTIDGPKIGPRASMYQARKLVAQRNILGHEIGAVLENGSDNGENQWALERHPANHSLSPNVPEKSAISPPYRIMTRHSREKFRGDVFFPSLDDHLCVGCTHVSRMAGPAGVERWRQE